MKETRTITTKEVQEMNVSTFSVKDSSPRGIRTESKENVKPGDKIVIDNYFHLVIENEREDDTMKKEKIVSKPARKRAGKNTYTTEHGAKFHISVGNSKMGNIPSFSLPAGVTCSKEACATCFRSGCYAAKIQRLRPNVAANYADNLKAAQIDLDGLEKALNAYFASPTAPRFFRVHVSGDFFSRLYAEMWYRVALVNPGVQFLAFTKQWDIVRAVPFHKLDNFALRLSDWPGTIIPADLTELYRVSYCDDHTRPAETFTGALQCPGHCAECVGCWNTRIDTVFKKH